LFSDDNKYRRKIKVVDFGIAGCRNEETFAGTPSYMAPEMLAKINTKATKALDIFALGIILYVMLFNKHPFK
jgi:serine/threonine protein kinase